MLALRTRTRSAQPSAKGTARRSPATSRGGDPPGDHPGGPPAPPDSPGDHPGGPPDPPDSPGDHPGGPPDPPDSPGDHPGGPPDPPGVALAAVAEGTVLAAYRFQRHKSAPEPALAAVTLLVDGEASLATAGPVLRRAEVAARATLAARDLVNE